MFNIEVTFQVFVTLQVDVGGLCSAVYDLRLIIVDNEVEQKNKLLKLILNIKLHNLSNCSIISVVVIFFLKVYNISTNVRTILMITLRISRSCISESVSVVSLRSL